MNHPLRVIVADDQPVIRDGIAAVLRAQADIDVVGCASNGQEIIELVEGGTVPDVALVDIRMPGVDGIEACRRIADRTSVLILTTFDLDEYVTDALRAGASGFLLKEVPAARLVEAVRLVAGGSMLLGPNVTRRLVEDLAGRPARPLELSDLGLTQREQDVFAHLARGRSNAEIATALVVAPETVKSHVAEVLRKLQLRDRVQVVVFAHERGLVHAGSTS